MKKVIITIIVLVLILISGKRIAKYLSYRSLSFSGYITEVNGDNVSIVISSETDIHNGHVYIRENKTKDGFVATREDIGRPVVAFITDPGTPADVTDDILKGFWVF